jgi:hypothetical protein
VTKRAAIPQEEIVRACRAAKKAGGTSVRLERFGYVVEVRLTEPIEVIPPEPKPFSLIGGPDPEPPRSLYDSTPFTWSIEERAKQSERMKLWHKERKRKLAAPDKLPENFKLRW